MNSDNDIVLKWIYPLRIRIELYKSQCAIGREIDSNVKDKYIKNIGREILNLDFAVDRQYVEFNLMNQRRYTVVIFPNDVYLLGKIVRCYVDLPN